MSSKRILIVDDSTLYQRILSDVINACEEFDVVGVASNGRIALDMMQDLKPDLVTLDILMPELDGIQTLMELRKSWPTVKAVMVSSLVSEGSDIATDVMSLGASGFAVKPCSAGSINNIRAELIVDLLPRIKALFGVEQISLTTTATKALSHMVEVSQDAQPKNRKSASPSVNQGVDIVAIGVSTGGPDALAKLLSALPVDLGVPIVIVQHMPAQFTSKLANRLNAVSELNVVEAQNNEKIFPGTVYIAPGDYHMTLDRNGSEIIVKLNTDELENSCRPSVDPLFRSIPAIYGSKCLGVILTGMGSDGLKGCEVLNKAGCPIIVQDNATSIVWGMPKLVALAGHAQDQVALDKMAGGVMNWVNRPSAANCRDAANSDIHRNNTISGRCT